MSHSHKILMLCIFLMASDASYGQIYKCKDGQGGVNFTDRPCQVSTEATVVKKPEEKVSGARKAEPASAHQEVPEEVAGNKFEEQYLPGSIKLKVRHLLESGRYRDLNVQLALYHAAAVASPEDEEDLFTAYAAFDNRQTAYKKYLDRWLIASPEAYPPYLARGYYFYGLAWAARGGRWSSETSTSQFDAMQNYFSDARVDLAEATVRGAPSLIPSYLYMGMWKTSGPGDDSVPLMMRRAQDQDDSEMAAYLNDALYESPASYEIRAQFLRALYPRWGGSYEAMARFSRMSQEFVKQNPRIALLEGYVDADIAFTTMNKGAHLKADTIFKKALRHGANAQVLKNRGKNSFKQEKFDESLGYFNQSINAFSEDGETYYWRSWAYRKLKKLDNALADSQRALLLDATDEDTQKLREYLAADFHRLAHQHLEDLDYRRAVELYGKSLGLDDKRAEVFFNRAWALTKLGKYDDALVDAKQAIELKPTHYKSYVLLDRILMQSKDWRQIIRYWNSYIAIQPNNPDAYVERSGTYLHYGDAAASLRDLKKAGDLGHVKARERYEALVAKSNGGR